MCLIAFLVHSFVDVMTVWLHWYLLQIFSSCKNFVQAESLVKAQQDMGETMGELGLAFIKLTKFENEEAVSNSQRVRAADMKGVATATVKASRLFRELNGQTVKHLVYNKTIAILSFQLYVFNCLFKQIISNICTIVWRGTALIK